MATVPFENLEFHYCSYRFLPTDVKTVYDNIVTKRRGGVCLQAHQLLTLLLRSYGFSVYFTGARLNAPAGTNECAEPTLEKTKILWGSW